MALLAALSLIPQSPVQAQTTNATGGLDLPLVAPEDVPHTGMFYLLSTLELRWGENRDFGPPLPYNPVPQADVFFTGTNSLAGACPDSFIVDDTPFLSASEQALMNTPEPPPDPGGGGP